MAGMAGWFQALPVMSGHGRQAGSCCNLGQGYSPRNFGRSGPEHIKSGEGEEGRKGERVGACLGPGWVGCNDMQIRCGTRTLGGLVKLAHTRDGHAVAVSNYVEGLRSWFEPKRTLTVPLDSSAGHHAAGAGAPHGARSRAGEGLGSESHGCAGKFRREGRRT